jgi:hypothetical protein
VAGKPGASGGLAAPINARAPGTIVLSLSRNHMSAEAPMQAASLTHCLRMQTRHGERGAIPALERRCWPMPDALGSPTAGGGGDPAGYPEGAASTNTNYRDSFA